VVQNPRERNAVHRHKRHENEPDRGKMTEPGKIVAPVRIDDCRRRRQRLIGLVVIDHDDIDAEPARFRQRLDAGRAAVDRHQSVAPRAASARTASTFGP
jgi:hypothetical protein